MSTDSVTLETTPARAAGGRTTRRAGIALVLGAGPGDRIGVEINERSTNPAAHGIRFSAKDKDIVVTPGAGATGDPVADGATAVVFSASDCQCIPMRPAPGVAPGWTASPTQGTPKRFRWRDGGTGSSAQLKAGRLAFRLKGGVTYGLDATPQGEVEVQVRFGSAGGAFCARFASPARPAMDDSPTKYKGKAFATGTAACSAVPARCGQCAADPSTIEFVSSTVVQGFQIDYYRNTAYPCSLGGGHQTFALGYRQGTVATALQPLWVFMHGGGVGHFDSNGLPRPDSQYMSEESLDSLLYSPAGGAADPGLMALVAQDPAGFRILGVSMCNRDFYNGIDQPDPHNPNQQPDGRPVTTNGLVATQAAIQFAKSHFTTSKYFLHGGSAGSAGSYGLAWSLQQRGDPPAGVVADSGLINQEWLQAVAAQGIPCPTAIAAGAPMTPAEVAAVSARLDPAIADIANEPDKLVASGRLTVPLMNVWTYGDPFFCGSTPMSCPLRDGSTTTLGSTDCMYEPMRAAVAAQGPTSRSANLRLCVQAQCAKHFPTRIAGTSTNPASPAGYNAAIMSWVHARLADQ